MFENNDLGPAMMYISNWHKYGKWTKRRSHNNCIDYTNTQVIKLISDWCEKPKQVADYVLIFGTLLKLR